MGAAVEAGFAGDGDALSVVGVFIDFDADACDEDVEWFTPMEDAARIICEAEDQEAEKVEAELSLMSMVEWFEDVAAYDGYWHYKGSLTTPNCFEIVNWIVAKNNLIARPEQVSNRVYIEM